MNEYTSEIMTDLLMFLGSLILSIILFSIPMITVLSFVLSWYSFIKFLLVILFVTEIILTAIYIGTIVKVL